MSRSVAVRSRVVLARWLRRRVRAVDPARVRRALRGPTRRALFLWAVFAAMPRAVRGRALARERVVIEWRITGRRDGRPDVRQLVIEDGAATVLAGEPREPQLRLTIDAVDLLLLATGNASGPALFVRGDVEIDGDPWLAMRLPGLFAI